MTLLDIEVASLIADVVNKALDKYFPYKERVEIIAEPGRYFVASAFTLAVNIIAKRVVSRDEYVEYGELLNQSSASDEPSIMYYVSDGIFGSFSCQRYDPCKLKVSVVKEPENDLSFKSSVWGPTCAGLDCIMEEVQLPEQNVNNWLYFQNMGAYTIVAASSFNGMPTPTHFYHCQADLWHEIYPESTEKLCYSIDDTTSLHEGRAPAARDQLQ